MTHNNNELLIEKNKELENNKNTEIKKYEYSLKRSLIKRTPEEHLIRENEILSKTVLEILLRFSKKQFSGSQKTDEEITELLSQPDWREKAQFEVGDYQCKEEGEVSECIGHYWAIPWLIPAREPIEIIENLKKDNEEAITHLTDYHFEQLEEKDAEISELKKELEEKGLRIKDLETKLEESELKEKTHIEAFEVSERWNKNQKAELIQDYNDVVDLLDESEDLVEKQGKQIENLQKDLGEKSELLEEANEVIKKQEATLCLFNKPLPSLPKKQNKIKQSITKTKIKVRQLAKKVKSQAQELIARIEVKTN